MQPLLGLSSSATSQRLINPPLIQDRQPTWSRVTTRSSKKRYLHTSVVFKHYIITCGGSKDSDGFDDAFGDIVVFNVNTYEWRRAKTKGHPVAPRYAHTACLYNEDKMVVFGGHDNITLDETFFFTLDEENIYSVQCEEKYDRKKNGEYARCRHTANIFENKMYVFGGLDRNGDSTNTLWSLDLNSIEWTKCKTAGNIPEERYGHSSAIHNNCLYVFGGHRTQSDEFMSDLYIMDLNAFVWDRVQTVSSPSPRRGMSLVGKNEKLYMFGGCDYTGSHLDDLHVLDLNEYTWKQAVTKNNSPDGRSRHSAVYYDEGMFVWGGSGHACHSDIYHLDLRLLEREGNRDSYQDYVSQIKDLYTTMKFADIDFVVGTERFAAHKVILATRSPFFAKLFFNGGKEFNGTEIVIDDVLVDSFEAILEYIYSNRITINNGNAADIFQLANKWGLKKLENQCEQFLIDNLNLSNYVEIANVAARVGAEELIETAVEFGTQHLDSLKSDKLSDLSQTILVKTIFKVKEVGNACKCRSRRRCRCKYSRFK